MIRKQLKFILLLITSIAFYSAVCHGDLGTDKINDRVAVSDYVSPSLRFNEHNPKNGISSFLNDLGANENHKEMFNLMMQNEVPGFIGYHGAANDFRIFQDIIRVAIEEYLHIPIRSDFQFLRVPGSSEFCFESADHFNAKYPHYDDQNHHIQAHLLSINIALFYFWDFWYDFTPRYFLHNFSSNKPMFEEKLEPFFKKFGLERKQIDEIFALAKKFLPKNRGIILQLFDLSHEQSIEPYAFANAHAFEANRYSRAPFTKELSIYYLFPDDNQKTKTNKYWLPRLGLHGSSNPNSIRLLLSDKYSLNPNSPLIILRYHTMTPEEESEYEMQLRAFMRNLLVDQELADKFREDLLNLWYSLK